MKNNPKVIVIGVDGATWKILNPLIKSGKLPFIQKMKMGGASGILHSTRPSISCPAWATFYTGSNPGKHGIFNFYLRRQNALKHPIINVNDIKAKKLWQYLDQKKLRSLFINAPITYPPPRINGVLISSFLTPKNAVFTSPKSIQLQLESHDYQINLPIETSFGNLPQHTLTKDQSKNTLKAAIKLCNQRVQAFKLLTKQADYNFYFIYFKMPDQMQHLFYGTKQLAYFWQQLDRTLFNLYTYIEKAIKGDKIYFIISDHGFHPTAKLQFSPYVWLKNELKLKTNNQISVWKILHEMHDVLKKAGFNFSKIKFIGKQRHKLVTETSHQQLNHFVIKHGILPTIEGIYFLKPYDLQLINDLVKKAQKLTHQGKKIFQLVSLNRDIYHGPQAYLGPDIVWQPNPDFTINTSPIESRLVIKSIPHLKGEHFADPEGIIIASGEGIKPQKDLSANLEDMLPTILHTQNIGYNLEVDGKVIIKLFQKSSPLKKRRVLILPDSTKDEFNNLYI